MLTPAKDLNSLREQLGAEGVEFLMASFSDMHGVSKTKMVPLAHLEHMMAGSELYTGAALDGVPQDVSDEEVSARPDPASCIVLPWQKNVAWFASNLWCEGKPFEACSRNILARATRKAADLGYVMNLGLEAEFYVLKDSEAGPVPVSERDTLEKPCYDGYGALDNLHWLSELVDAIEALGWDVYSFDHEDGNGQFEVDFRFADAMTPHGLGRPLQHVAGESRHGREPLHGPGRPARLRVVETRLSIRRGRAQAPARHQRRRVANGEQL